MWYDDVYLFYGDIEGAKPKISLSARDPSNDEIQNGRRRKV